MARIRHAWGLAALALPAALIACKTTWNSHMPKVDMPDRMRVDSLTRSQYEVLGKVESEGCAEYYALWPLPIFWVQSDDQSGTTPGRKARAFSTRLSDAATSSAQFKAMKSRPEADALLYPQYHEIKERYIWYKKSCVKVQGKAIRVKVDGELTEEQLSDRPRTIDAVVRP